MVSTISSSHTLMPCSLSAIANGRAMSLSSLAWQIKISYFSFLIAPDFVVSTSVFKMFHHASGWMQADNDQAFKLIPRSEEGNVEAHPFFGFKSTKVPLGVAPSRGKSQEPLQSVLRRRKSECTVVSFFRKSQPARR